MITHKEVSEAKMYGRLDTLTDWQSKRIVQLYLKLLSSKMVLVDIDHPRFNEVLEKAKEYFNGKSI